jgi:hypothetical protein
MRAMLVRGVAALAAAVMACGPPEGGGGPVDGAGEAGGADAGPDAAADAGPDATADAGADAGADATADAGADAGADATADAGADAGADVAADAGADAGADAAAALDPGEVCPALHEALCAAEQGCCQGVGRWPSAALCQSGEGDVCAIMAQVFSNPALGFDGEVARTYLTDVGTSSAACSPQVASLLDAKPPFVQGTLPQGGACTMASTADLVGLWACQGEQVCFPGVAGGQLAPGSCGPLAGAGGSCLRDEHCALGHYCAGSGSSPPSAGQCAAGLPGDAPCGHRRQCAGGACEQGACTAATTDLLYCFNGPESGLL